MIHRVSARKLGRGTKERKALLKSLANSVVLYEKITTTEAKAKAVRPFLEKLVTVAKEDSLTARRRLTAKLGFENSVRKLLEVVGPTFKERPGGYLRLTKLGPRAGDSAPMVVVEFVEALKLPKIVAKENVRVKKSETKKVEVKKRASKKVEETKKPVKKTKTALKKPVNEKGRSKKTTK
ncbi:MAG: 50S ribosomal protein L17 [Candidatus Woykebacteria bacterium]